MKKFLNVYRTFKTPIRVCFFGFILIAIGFFIKNENVNLFYTFKSSVVLFIGEICFKVGELIVMNLPLIFMLAGVTKKAHNTTVIATALIGYFTFMVTTMIFANQSLGAQAYSSGTGINSLFNTVNGTRLPLETGLIGSLIVAYATRVSFVVSRYRRHGSIMHLFSKESLGMILNILLCFLLGMIVAYVYPLFYQGIQAIISFIANDFTDPFRIGLYSVFDRVISLLGLGNIVRYPFWYTSLGGSFSNASTGQVILGDVNIWTAIKNATTTYSGAGRFVTFYYVINIFLIPAFYIGLFISMSDKKEKGSLAFLFILGILLSVLAGNPLPLEFIMVATSPFLYLGYLLLTGLSAGVLSYFNANVGFSPVSTNAIVATPGTLADLLVNIRNAALTTSVYRILEVGLVAFILMILLTVLYYKKIVYNMPDSNKLKEIANQIVDSVNGIDNIKDANSGLFKLNIDLIDSEIVSFEKLRLLDVGTIYETKDGFTIECGAASTRIADLIKQLKQAQEQ